MKKISAAIAALALFGLASPASAAVTMFASAPGFQGPAGADFEPANVGVGPLASGYTEAGLTFDNIGGSVKVLNNTTGEGAFPFGRVSTQYLSVLGGGSVDVNFSGLQSRVGFYWGSVDGYNTVEFYNGATLVGTFTGGNATPTLTADGNQGVFASNRYVTLVSTAAFDSVRLSSTSNSFEVDNISAGVPEPSTWAMMLLGFFGLGFATLRRSRKLATIKA